MASSCSLAAWWSSSSVSLRSNRANSVWRLSRSRSYSPTWTNNASVYLDSLQLVVSLLECYYDWLSDLSPYMTWLSSWLLFYFLSTHALNPYLVMFGDLPLTTLNISQSQGWMKCTSTCHHITNLSPEFGGFLATLIMSVFLRGEAQT